MEYPSRYFKVEQYKPDFESCRVEQIRLNNKKNQKPLNSNIPTSEEEKKQILKMYSDNESLGTIIEYFQKGGEPALHIYDMIRQTKIKALILDRKIKKLIHFTDAENRNSIEKFGLLSRTDLDQKDIKYSYNDKKRWDGYLDGISISVTSRNEPLFTTFRLNAQEIKWIEISLNPNIIIDTDCLFFDYNAASKKYKNFTTEYLSSFSALEKMFSECIENNIGEKEKRKEKTPNETTSQQAEVIVLSKIGPSEIINIRNIN